MPEYFDSTTVFPTSARVLSLTQRQVAGFNISLDQLRARASERAFDPVIFEENQPIFFPAEMSSNGMDAYWTRMTPVTLRNYAQDAETGVSFQDSHDTRALGLGATLSGRYIEGENDLVRALADVFTVRGTPDINDFIHKLRAGIARYVSVGFYQADFICGICGLDLFDWDCSHIPGLLYNVTEMSEKGEKEEREEVRAFAWVDNARLAELSAVYKGATPGAGIFKARQEAEGGRMTPQLAESFQITYRGLAVPSYQRFFALGGTENPASPAHHPARRASAEQGGTMPKETDKPAETTTERAAPTQDKPAAEDFGQRLIAVCGDLKLAAPNAADGLRQLTELARDGQTFRATLIEDALKEGVRAFGKDFDQTSYRAMFERLDVVSVKRMLDDWRKLSAAKFPAGRQTTEETTEGATDDAGAATDTATGADAGTKSGSHGNDERDIEQEAFTAAVRLAPGKVFGS